jgi:hypothetical protein
MLLSLSSVVPVYENSLLITVKPLTFSVVVSITALHNSSSTHIHVVHNWNWLLALAQLGAQWFITKCTSILCTSCHLQFKLFSLYCSSCIQQIIFTIMVIHSRGVGFVKSSTTVRIWSTWSKLDYVQWGTVKVFMPVRVKLTISTLMCHI